MDNKKDLIKEAIADAKAVREVALANAKLALQEAFEPRLKTIMSAHLEEELNEGDDEEKEMTDEELEEMMKDDKEETSMEEEIDINQLLAELEEASKEEEDEMPLEEAEDKEEEEEGEEEGEEKEEEEEEIDLGDMTKEDLVDLIKDVISQEMEGDSMEDEMTADEMGTDEMEADDMMMEEEEDEDEKKELEEVKKAKLKMKEKYNKDLEEALQTITLLKNELNEVNLLNAKLLYANKLFNKYSLSEGQKLKVINSFDNAETVRETKLVFNTLNESFESENKVKKEKTKSITEGLGMASKPVGSVKKPAGMLNESNEFVSRLQKLANIKL
jgi:hypothetical protein